MCAINDTIMCAIRYAINDTITYNGSEAKSFKCHLESWSGSCWQL